MLAGGPIPVAVVWKDGEAQVSLQRGVQAKDYAQFDPSFHMWVPDSEKILCAC